MAAYCRVSTDRDEQLLSYENQLRYYREYIENNPMYEFAGVYADEGISATNTKKRDEFNKMIEDCRNKKIDRIITKSISRFARNTLDCLNYVRELKALGIGVTFEKENIDTLDSKGEVLLTILSSLAQDESRSISENTKWGIRRRYENGEYGISTKRFMGYDIDEDGKLKINKAQAKVVKRLYTEYLNGKTVDYIKRIFEREGVKNWNGEAKWQVSTLKSMLENEKYKGDALLQKSYTADFLTKKRTKNKGEMQMYYIEESHEAIISPEIWECVQLETARRAEYMRVHNLKCYSRNTEQNPFTSKIICGECGHPFSRKEWRNRYGGKRKIWQCSERYKIKGVEGCTNRHTDEETLIKAFIMAWNTVLENRTACLEKWKKQTESEDLLKAYRAKEFMKYTENTSQIREFEADFMLKVLNHIKVFENGTLTVAFLDGTEVELQ